MTAVLVLLLVIVLLLAAAIILVNAVLAHVRVALGMLQRLLRERDELKARSLPNRRVR